jgi:hypothetical protein
VASDVVRIQTSAPVTCSRQAVRRASSRSLALRVFFPDPAQPMSDNPADRRERDADAADLLPPGAELFERGVGLLGQSGRQGTGKRSRIDRRGTTAGAGADGTGLPVKLASWQLD